MEKMKKGVDKSIVVMCDGRVLGDKSKIERL